jgi:hypothetical protein
VDVKPIAAQCAAIGKRRSLPANSICPRNGQFYFANALLNN